MTRTWLIAAFVAAALLVLFFFSRGPGVAVEVAVVRKEALAVTVDEQGRTRTRESFIVAAPVTGRMLRALVNEGQPVAAGEVLATMVAPPQDPRVRAELAAQLDVAVARLKEAEAALSEAQSSNARAQREAARRLQLFEQGAVSVETKEQYEQAAVASVARLNTARASLRAANAEVERVRAQLLGADSEASGADDAGAPVRAPASGTVLFVFEESERVVQAGTPLFEIGDSHGLEVIVDLLTDQAVRVRPGAEVHITGWGGGATLAGSVRYVEPKGFEEVSALGVEEQRVNVIIDLNDAPSSLGAEFRVEAAIVVWEGENVLTVPTSALFQRGRGWRTFVVTDDRAELRSVEIGHRGRERAEVLGGLEEDDRVVVFPSDLVEDGVRVDPRPSLAESE